MLDRFGSSKKSKARRRLKLSSAGVLAALAIFAVFNENTSWAGQSLRPVRVATRIVAPFVFEEDGKLAGFSIDLWRSIAAELMLESQFSLSRSVQELLSNVESGKSNVGIAAISITAERSKSVDFSQPMFDSGLQIMVRTQSGKAPWLRGLLAIVWSSAILPLVAAIILIILVPAHLIWWFERRHPHGIIESKTYIGGLFEACWWAAATLATQADQMPKSVAGRLIAVLWMFASVVFVAYFTANVTASLTVQQLQGEIKGPQDLPGKEVATTVGSTSAMYLKQRQIQPLEFERIEQAYEALLEGRADAVVFDAPVLWYYAAREGKGKVEIVGPVFRKESYGIAFPNNSALRKPVDSALLRLKENGTYQALYEKWFARGE